MVNHDEIFADASHLPSFSSPAIESNLHRIPGLSRRFIYFNDDVMLGAPTYPEDFHSPSTGQKVYLSWEVPKCNQGCADSWIGDGQCDLACNVSQCLWDLNDCENTTSTTSSQGGRNSWSRRSGNSHSARTGSFYCASGCSFTWVGDKVCDNKCENVECGWDGGDCGMDLIWGKNGHEGLWGIDLPGVASDDPDSADLDSMKQIHGQRPPTVNQSNTSLAQEHSNHLTPSSPLANHNARVSQLQLPSPPAHRTKPVYWIPAGTLLHT